MTSVSGNLAKGLLCLWVVKSLLKEVKNYEISLLLCPHLVVGFNLGLFTFKFYVLESFYQHSLRLRVFHWNFVGNFYIDLQNLKSTILKLLEALDRSCMLQFTFGKLYSKYCDMNTGLLLPFWKSLSKRSYSNWSNVKEFKQYLVSKESLKLTKGLFETRVLIEQQDIETAQSITYKHFKESNWTWSKDNPTGLKQYILIIEVFWIT